MNKFCLLALFCLIIVPLDSNSQGYSISPQESVADLTIVSTDATESSFVIKTKNGEYITGIAGDYLGYEEAEVVEVTDRYIILETIELIVGKDGSQHEQPTRTKIPLSFATYGKGMGNM